MRKLHLLSAVLSLFLLVPALITRAQVTKTLNGVVRYESGISKSTFATPNGDVVVNLPQSMSGSVITGTVSTQPAGKTEKEKSRNLKELLKMVVNLDGQNIPLTASPSNFDWLTHMDRPARTPMELLSVSGNKLGEVSLPPVISTLISNDPAETPVFSTPSNIIVKGDALNIYTNKQFSPGEKFVVTDSKGQTFTLKPICLSAQQAILILPDNIVPGECTAREEVWNYPTHPIEKVAFRLTDIQLSSPNTNLRPGQNSSVTITVNQGNGNTILGTEREIFLERQQFNIDLRNLNQNTVTMEGGNLQRVNVSYSKKTLVSGEQTVLMFQLKREITGNAVGSFSVSATLHEGFTTSNDPFRPQLNVLRTPEDFNAWSTALKKDLKVFASLRFDDEAAVPLTSYAQSAINNMPIAASAELLDEAKAVAYSLLQPLRVPKGAAISWLSSYEATKAATKAIDNALAGNTELIDYDVLKNGMEFINRVGGQLKDASLQIQCNNIQQLINDIQTGAETKENLQQLRDKINELMVRADSRIESDDPAGSTDVPMTTGMKKLLLASYQLPSLAQPGRIHPFNDLVAYMDTRKGKLLVIPEYKDAILNMIGAQPMPNGHYKMIPFGNNQKPSGFEVAIQYIDQVDLFKAANNGNNINLKLKPITINFPGQGLSQPVPNGGTISWETSTDGGLAWTPDRPTGSDPQFIHLTDNNWPGTNMDSLRTEMIKGISFDPVKETKAENEKEKFTGWWISTPGLSIPGIPDAMPYPKNEDKAKPWSWMIQDDIDWKGFDLPQLTPAGGEELIPIKPGDGSKDEIPYPFKDRDRYRWEIGLIPVKPIPGTGPSPEKLKEFAEAFNKLFGPGAKPIIPNPLGYYYPVFIAKPKTTDNSTTAQPFFVVLPEANNKSTDSKYAWPWNDPKDYKWTIFLPPQYPNGRMQVAPSFFFPPKDFFKDVYFEEKTEPEDLKPDTEFTDSAGTKYKFYKDAECVKISESKGKDLSECRPEEKYQWDKDGKGGFVLTGKYFKIETMGSSWCKKGNGFCVEMEQVDAIVSIYEDKNCTRMIDVRKILGFKCQ